MKPAPFDYHRATSVADAIAVLAASEGSGKLLAGGQSLVPLLSMRMAQPTVLIDLNGLGDLSALGGPGASADGPATDGSTGSVGFGSMMRHSELCRQTAHPLAAEMAGWIAHTAIRCRGTIGGSLAHADPNAECPALALVCDGRITVQGPSGQRRIAAADFFEGMLQTTLADDEILTAIDLALPARWGFAELARRQGDFAVVLAAVAELDDGWRVVVGGVDSTPIRVPAAEAALDSGVDGAEAGRLVETQIVAYDDIHGGASYRRAMAAELVRRACDMAFSQAAPSAGETGAVKSQP